MFEKEETDMLKKLRNFAAFTAIATSIASLTFSTSTTTRAATTSTMPTEGEVGLLLPIMNPSHGRMLFASKGCVVCHAINGVGGKDAPALDASTMAGPMNPFDFAAKMWHGAAAMINMQQSELGKQIEFTGAELADIIAFAHDAKEQKKFSKADIPEKIQKLMDKDD